MLSFALTAAMMLIGTPCVVIYPNARFDLPER